MLSSSTSNKSAPPSSSPDQVSNSLPSSSPNISHSPSLPEPQMVTRSKHNIFKPRQILDLHTTTISVDHFEPTTLNQAQKIPHWRKAMSEEYDALLSNHTWNLVPPHHSQNIIGCKWIFKIKKNSDGTVSRYKARLVAKGFHQRPGIDFTDTFSPVVKPRTIRVILSIAVSYGWDLRQLDVNNAFLQGTLTDDVYMQQPPGFQHSQYPNHVCKLRKAIYGLRQAPRAWYNELRHFLLLQGFMNSKSDSSLFIFHQDYTIIYLLVYVDDIIVIGNKSSSIHKFIQQLATRFSLKDLGSLHYFLGVDATFTTHGLSLSQKKIHH